MNRDTAVHQNLPEGKSIENGDSPFRGLGIFGSGWHRQNWTTESLDGIDLEGLEEEDRQWRATSSVNNGATRFLVKDAHDDISLRATFSRLAEERCACERAADEVAGSAPYLLVEGPAEAPSARSATVTLEKWSFIILCSRRLLVGRLGKLFLAGS